MQNIKYIPIRALSACTEKCDSAGENCRCPEDETDGGYSDRPINTDPDNPDDAPEIDYDADARYWKPDPQINRETQRPYNKPTPNEDTWSRDRSVPYKGYQGNETRALMVDPQLGTLRYAPNQDYYGNPKYGTSGGWNSDFGGGGIDGGRYTDFSATGAA